MIRYALLFFIIALIAAAFGFGGIAVGAAAIARLVFWLFLVLLILSLASSFLKKI